MSTTHAAVNRWHGILKALGVDESHLVDRHGPCPICGGKDRFRFDDKEGRGTWYCNGCGAGDGMDLAMKITGKPFGETAKEIDRIIGVIPERTPKTTSRDPSFLLRKIYKGLISPAGTLAEKYLNDRGLSLPDMGIRFHPNLAYYDDGHYVASYPAMVAIFSNSQGKPISLHITYLNADGTKLKRKIMPPKESLNGGSIQLTAPAEVMGIAEGIETALSAAFIGEVPVWASATAGLLENWTPPDIAREIHIYGDNDQNYCGHAAAYKLAHKLTLKGYKATVCIPQHVNDWNDSLIQYKQRGAA